MMREGINFDALCKRFVELLKCDSARISCPSGETMFLIIGHNRNTKQDRETGQSLGQWYKDGVPVDYDYVQEAAIASGTTEAELGAAVDEYHRLSGMTMLDYLREILPAEHRDAIDRCAEVTERVNLATSTKKSPKTSVSSFEVLARRAYPGLKHSGACSAHREDGHFGCEVCYPDANALLDAHVAAADNLYDELLGVSGLSEPPDGRIGTNAILAELRRKLEPASESKYYEIICSAGVTGVCSGTDDVLLHIAQEDNVLAFGEITEADFHRYGDDSWQEPISTRRWKPSVHPALELTPIT